MQYRSSERAEGHGVPYLCILKITLSPDCIIKWQCCWFWCLSLSLYSDSSYLWLQQLTIIIIITRAGPKIINKRCDRVNCLQGWFSTGMLREGGRGPSRVEICWIISSGWYGYWGQLNSRRSNIHYIELGSHSSHWYWIQIKIQSSIHYPAYHHLHLITRETLTPVFVCLSPAR